MSTDPRGVPYKNGEMIAAIACEGIGGSLLDWHERKFMNRYGERIFEDVITLMPAFMAVSDAIEIGREVGTQALRNSLNYCASERVEEIEAAIEASNRIECSPPIKQTGIWNG